ncbi:hypothetical protein, partial [Escherichia coli]|uniref:hypothetical protein n=1 Tax=Escherichia coli TaxID=562 RepID=UPI0023AE71B3
LSWLFLQFDGSVPFTELVDQAWQQGLTEPDPRDDLSGKDVMRCSRSFTRSTATHTILVVRVTGTCRDQTTLDNVLFQAAQFVAFARNGCFGQHACGLLERCRG